MAAAIHRHRYECTVCLRRFRQEANALAHFCWSPGDIIVSESAYTSLKSYETAAQTAVVTSEKSYKAALSTLHQVKAEKAPVADKARVRAKVENANLTALKAADQAQTIMIQVGKMAKATNCQSRIIAAAEVAGRIDLLAKQVAGYVSGIEAVASSMDRYFQQKGAESEPKLEVVLDPPEAARARRPTVTPQVAKKKSEDSDCAVM